MPSNLKESITKTKMELFEVECTQCGEMIQSRDVNIDTSLAKCIGCSSVFSIQEAAFEKRRRGHPIFLVPDGTEVLKLITSLEISSSWLKASKKDKIKFDFIMTFSFLITSILGLIGGIWGNSLIVVLFSSFFLLTGMILSYIFLANLINKTLINIADKMLSISYGPLKILGMKKHRIPIEQIDQLYVKEYQTNRSVNDIPLKANAIYIKLKNGDEIKLIDDMNRETSLFLEQEIEEFILIEDKAVGGEIEKV